MKNYVIINGTNSNTLTGLMINELPPITKPEMRTQVEEIDGRDGDIITKLGYSAYDKTITIGLFGTGYDVDNIIKFFNKEGTIVFSNEPDKYYNFTQVNGFDIERLLKFKTASITFHCQPFKYPLTETPLEIEYDYIESEGETLTLNNTGNSTLKLDLKGNTSQEGTPTPTSPIPVSVVSGDNTITVSSKNMFDGVFRQGGWNGPAKIRCYSVNGIFVNGNNTKYTISTNIDTTLYKWEVNVSKEILPASSFTTVINSGWQTGTKCTLTVPSNGGYLYLGFAALDGTSNINVSDIEQYHYQVEVGEEATTYEAFTGQKLNLSLPVENILKYPFEQTTKTESGITFTDNGDGSITVNGTATANVLFYLTDNSYSSDYFRSAVLNKQITISGCPSGGSSTTYRIQLGGAGGNTIYDTGSGATTTFTNSSSSYNLVIGIASGTTCNNLVFKPMVEYGSKKNTYQPYGTTPIELCKIGTYQDYFTKNSDGEWCKYNAIGKVVLDGSENWAYVLSGSNSIHFATISNKIKQRAGLFLNYYKYGGTNLIWQTISNNEVAEEDGNATIFIRNDSITSKNDFITWLGTHNTSVYYILATPYLSLIEDTNLIEQLDAIQNAVSYTGQTNISQVNNDKPFIISAKALEDGTNEVVVNNIGNVYSKPLLALEGSGNVDIYLDNTQILQANVEDKMNIDIAQLEAYNPDTMTLLNRQVIGNYNSMTLQPGNNTIRIDGALDKATITNYTRYL